MKLNIEAIRENFDKNPRSYIEALMLLAILYLVIDNKRLQHDKDELNTARLQDRSAEIISLKETLKQQKDVFEIQKNVVDAAILVLSGDSTQHLENKRY